MKSFNIYTVLLTLYLIVIFVPILETVDKAGVQWLYLNLLNILSFLILIRDLAFFKNFYKNKLFLAYSFFSITALITYFSAFNENEVMIEFVRNINIFIAYAAISVFIAKQKSIKFLFPGILAITFLANINLFKMVYELFTFSEIDLNIANKLPGYTMNKNINTYVILTQTPLFLISLFYIKSNWYKLLVGINLFIVFTLLFVYGTRSGFIVLAIITFFLSIQTIRNFRDYKFNYLTFVIPLLLAFLYNKTNNLNYSSQKRITSLSLEDSSVNNRIAYWESSINQFKKSPIIGIGAGNWKILGLEDLKEDLRDYIAPFHVHNDFLQVLSERGIIGFLSFVMIFILCYVYLIKQILKDKNNYIDFFLFIALTAYFFDSAFNFPLNRPVMQVQFALILALITNRITKTLKIE